MHMELYLESEFRSLAADRVRLFYGIVALITKDIAEFSQMIRSNQRKHLIQKFQQVFFARLFTREIMASKKRHSEIQGRAVFQLMRDRQQSSFRFPVQTVSRFAFH